mmetsp:Transcript_18047/g.36710  ORF Transcript_18047/g.36710 Transcript_18047/m.36710 type:complete len:871 (+) Transcript_18047:174-2786(+)
MSPTPPPWWAVENQVLGHNSTIRTLRFSRGLSAGSVFATGGDDKKVNLWRVGRSASGPVTSMGGNASPVVSLCFSPSSEQLLSASEGGSLKIFDIAEGRIARSLNGHLARVNAVDYHPYGEFVASGGDDTNVKVWDVRHKRCIQTYKGHTRYVSDVKFSPDGLWVASCSREDGTLKIWDLKAGKICHTFNIAADATRDGPCSFEFNPSEFLMAVRTNNNVIKILDMEKLQHISSTPNDPSRVHQIAWHEAADDSQAKLLSVNSDGLRSWEIEPEVRCFAGTEARWGGQVGDIVVNSANQLVVGSVNDDFLSIYAVELASLPARGTDNNKFESDMAAHLPRSSRGRTPTPAKTPQSSYASASRQRTPSSSSSSLGVGIVGHSVEKYNKSSSNLKTPSPHQQQYIVETPPSSEHKRLSESPIPPTHHYSPVLAPASRKDAKDDDDDDDGPLTVMMPNEFRSNLHRGDEGDDDDQCVSDAEAKELADRIVSMNEHKADLEPPLSSLNSSANNSTTDDDSRNLGHIYDFAGAMGAATPYSGTPSQSPDKSDAGKPHHPFGSPNVGELEDAMIAASNAVISHRREENKENSNKAAVSFKGGAGAHDLNHSLPGPAYGHQHNSKNGSKKSSPARHQLPVDEVAKDDQVIGQILLGRLGLSVCLAERIEKIKVLSLKWSEGRVGECFKFMNQIMDGDDDGSLEGAAVVADFLKSVNLKKALTLDVCGELLEVLVKMILPEGEDGDTSIDNDGTMNSLGESTIAIKGRPFAEVAMVSFATVLDAFGQYIFDTCMSGATGVGIDVEREERLNKCLECHKSFAKLADKMVAELSSDLESKEGDFSGGVQFMGLVDVNDSGAKRAAKRLAGLLTRYRAGYR